MMRKWMQIATWSLVVTLGMLSCAVASEPLGLSGARQLFVDDYLVDSMEGCVLKVHPGTKDAYAPREGGMGRASIVRRPDGTYEAFHSGRGSAHVVTSADGIHWDIPEDPEESLVLDRYLGERFIGTPAVFYDHRTPDPEERYKMGLWQFGGLCVAFSADGRTWRMHPPIPADSWIRDVIAPTWDPVHGRFLIPCQVNVRGWDYAGRAIGLSWSRDFRHWEPVGVVLRPDERDPLGMQMHGMAACWYESVFVGFVQMFHTQPQMIQQMAEGGEIAYQYIELATSRDGIDWTRPDERIPLIPLGSYEEDAWDAGRVSTVSRVLVKDDEVLLHYSGGSWPQTSRHPHQNDLYEGLTNHPLPVQDFLWQIPRQHGRSIVRWRLDGFVSVRAEREGVLVTKPFLAAGRELVVNADASKGRLTVEILDEDYQPLANRPASDPLTADALRHTCVFGGETEVLSGLAGRVIRLRFRLENADLYSFTLKGAPTEEILPGVPQETLAALPATGTEAEARSAVEQALALAADGRIYDAKRIGRAVLAEEGLAGWTSVRAPLVELLFFTLRLDEEILPAIASWLERDDVSKQESELFRFAQYVRAEDQLEHTKAQDLAVELIDATTLRRPRRVEVWHTYIRAYGAIHRRLKERAKEERAAARAAGGDVPEEVSDPEAEKKRIFEQTLRDTRRYFSLALPCTEWDLVRLEWGAQLLRDRILGDEAYAEYRPSAIWHWASLWGSLTARKSSEWMLTRMCDALNRADQASLVPAYRNYYRGLLEENPLEGRISPLPEEWFSPLGSVIEQTDDSWEGRLIRARTLFVMGRYRQAGLLFLEIYQNAPPTMTLLRRTAYQDLTGCVLAVEMRPGLALQLARKVQYDRTPLPGLLLDVRRFLGGEEPPLEELRRRVTER